MLIIVFLSAAFDLASNEPAMPSTTEFDVATHVTVFGRKLPAHTGSRTVQDIIWSCLATIFACAWVAVHPNVPRRKNSGWKTFWERFFVMVFAILSPEFIVAWALRQWRGAARHAAKYNQKYHGGKFFVFIDASKVHILQCHYLRATFSGTSSACFKRIRS